MRLRRAVPKFPAKSSAPPRLPLRKNRSLRTRSESTLPQLLIPLHFKSFISNVYKKPGEGCPVPGPKFCNSSPPSYCHSERSEESAFSSFRLYYLTSLPRYITPPPAPVYTQECPQVQSPHGLLHNSRTPRGWGGTSLAVVLTLSLLYFFAFDFYLTQTSPAARALSGPTSVGTGTSPPVDCQPANASAWRSHEESCAALRRLPPAVARGTNGPS